MDLLRPELPTPDTFSFPVLPFPETAMPSSYSSGQKPAASHPKMLSLTPHPFTPKPCSFSLAHSFHLHSSHPGPVPSLAACLCPCPRVSVPSCHIWAGASAVPFRALQWAPLSVKATALPVADKAQGGHLSCHLSTLAFPDPPSDTPLPPGLGPVLPSVGESFPRVSCAGLPFWSPSSLLKCHLPIVTLPED